MWTIDMSCIQKGGQDTSLLTNQQFLLAWRDPYLECFQRCCPSETELEWHSQFPRISLLDITPMCSHEQHAMKWRLINLSLSSRPVGNTLKPTLFCDVFIRAILLLCKWAWFLPRLKDQKNKAPDSLSQLSSNHSLLLPFQLQPPW